MPATITLHLPHHRERALQLQTEKEAATQAYDANIADYVRFLQGEAQKAGYVVVTDQSSVDSVYAIDAADREQKQAAHDWLETQPDLWNWIP